MAHTLHFLTSLGLVSSCPRLTLRGFLVLNCNSLLTILSPSPLELKQVTGQEAVAWNPGGHRALACSRRSDTLTDQ